METHAGRYGLEQSAYVGALIVTRLFVQHGVAGKF